MNLSEHLTLEEIEHSYTALRRGIGNKLPEEMLPCWGEIAERIFETIRYYFDAPIFVTSGYRSINLNQEIGGKLTSHHLGQCLIEGVPKFCAALDLWRPNPDERFAIFDIARSNLNLPYWQLIWEKGTEEAPDWIHVSYVQGVNPRQQIIPYRGV